MSDPKAAGSEVCQEAPQQKGPGIEISGLPTWEFDSPSCWKTTPGIATPRSYLWVTITSKLRSKVNSSWGDASR